MRGKYISASDTPSDDGTAGHQPLGKRGLVRTVLLILVLTSALISAVPVPGAGAELIDRVVAFIDDEAITLTDFLQYMAKAGKLTPGISGETAINALINRRLLLREAKRIRLRGKSDDELIREYVDIKVRVFIKIPPEEVERFYNENRERFGETPLGDVWDDIERLLREREVNRRLRKHIEKLREGAYIKINLTPS
ncbi:MAG: hypothetical protein GXO94_07835 [Nitrospirae bacterium]|nr:hypothetical protein [Nitrospirota bacterium]